MLGICHFNLSSLLQSLAVSFLMYNPQLLQVPVSIFINKYESISGHYSFTIHNFNPGLLVLLKFFVL